MFAIEWARIKSRAIAAAVRAERMGHRTLLKFYNTMPESGDAVDMALAWDVCPCHARKMLVKLHKAGLVSRGRRTGNQPLIWRKR